jgi:tetratricopeptide (TPR) repeat protein
MNLNELFGLFSSDEEKELKQLAQKAKGMYNKALENYEQIVEKNPKAFQSQPVEAFYKWFEHMFYKDVKRILDFDELYRKITERNLKNLIKPLIMLASVNYYLKPKTGYSGAETLVKIAPMIAKQDRDTLKVIEKFFGTFVRDGASKADTGGTVKIGAEITVPKGAAVPQDTVFTWKGRMWLNDKQQPADKKMQGALTQMAIDQGMTE